MLALSLLLAAQIVGTVSVSNQPVSGAIVYLGAGNGRAAAGSIATNITLSVRDGVLVPRVQVAVRGATLVLQNDDPTLRVVQVDALSLTNAVRWWTQAMPYAGFRKAFALEGFRDITLLRVSGGNGEAMVAYIAVLPHAWGAVTDENGRFALGGVPAGACKLYVWHETLGTLVREVRLPVAGPLELEFVVVPSR
jgi:hypothetical protein